MKLLDRMEKRFGHLAVPNIALYLIVIQLVIYAAILFGRLDYFGLQLMPAAVLEGEYWRLISFIISPPYLAGTVWQSIFLAFFWYIFWMMSGSLESAWGAFRFNLYLLMGVIFSVVCAFLGHFISPNPVILVTPMYLYLSVFFAFATLFPNVEFLIYFVLPVKVKWLACFAAAALAVSFLAAPSMGYRLAILGPVLNYLFFFRDAMTHSVKSRQRRVKHEKAKRVDASTALHTCSQCGASDQTDPDRDFRYKMVDGDAICICNKCREEV